MHHVRRFNDAAEWFMSDLRSRVVAQSGLPHDRYHLGKLILQSLKDAPDFVLQIDGGTGQSETCGSVLERSVRCANAMKEIGLKRGDIMILMAPSHIDLCIPFYAALYLGVIIAPIDRNFEIKELENVFNIDEPKVVFCQSERAKDVRVALDNCNFQDAKVITFDNEAGTVKNVMSFQDLLSHGNKTTVDNFKASDFDPADTTSCLVSTSGSTGLPKQSVLSHKNFALNGHYNWALYTQFPTPFGKSLVLSPLQWLTAITNFTQSPILRFSRLQSSSYLTKQHCYDLINTYKPNFTVLSPTLLTALFKSEDRDKCDFSSFDMICTGGSSVATALIDEVKSVCPKTDVFNAYGLTEIGHMALFFTHDAPGSSGKPTPYLQYRLVDVTTKEDIVEPNKSGELWLKGPNVFKGYYKNPTETQNALSDDGWLKTGDIFYRDEHWNFYCVDRMKMLIKYIDNARGLYPLISPVEIQNVIRQHPGVLDVAVTGIPDVEHRELPVACVVRRSGFTVTAQEIKDLVKKTLSEGKQLRGGVIFLDEIPITPTTKINYRKVKEIAMGRERE